MILGLSNLYFFVQDVSKRLKCQFSIYFQLFKWCFCKSKLHKKHHFQSDSLFNYPKNRWFLVEIGKNGPNFQFLLKNFRCIEMYPRGQVAKIHLHFNTVPPSEIGIFRWLTSKWHGVKSQSPVTSPVRIHIQHSIEMKLHILGYFEWRTIIEVKNTVRLLFSQSLFSQLTSYTRKSPKSCSIAKKTYLTSITVAFWMMQLEIPR